MLIGCIFALAKVEKRIISVVYEEGTSNAFEQLFDNWTDIEYLFNFFETHLSDLHRDFWVEKFGKRLTEQEAVNITRKEAINTRENILLHAENNTLNLSDLFKPLSGDVFYSSTYQSAYKSYGTEYKSWLRIYAVKVQNTYVITGGAIKLTQTMGEREHTKKELDNLYNVKRDLQRLLFDDDASFDEVFEYGYFEI